MTMSSYQYRCHIGALRSAIDKAASWQHQSFPDAKTGSHIMGIAARTNGHLYLAAAISRLWHVLLIPLDCNERNDDPPGKPMLSLLTAYDILELRNDLERLSADRRVQIRYNNARQHEIEFSWNNQKRTARDISVLVSDMFEPPPLVCWNGGPPVFSASIMREPWLEFLQGSNNIVERHVFTMDHSAPGSCSLSALEGQKNIDINVVGCQLPLSLIVRPLRAYLSLITEPCVRMNVYRLHHNPKLYTVELLTPEAEMYHYCHDASALQL